MNDRKEFEAWASVIHSAHYIDAKTKSGKYLDERMRLMYSAWCAAMIKTKLKQGHR